jgi:two-component system, cell cycle sensor histidine kinase and response regulator CckA
LNRRSLKVVAIDDDQADLRVLRRMLERTQTWEIVFDGYTDVASALNTLRDGHGDIIFLDYLLGAETGLGVLKALRRDDDRRPVIVLTGHGDEYVAAELMRCGASGYVAKHDLNPHMLRLAIDGALREQELERKNQELQEQLQAARKMEAIGTLAGGLAHDFNNILTGIIGTVELSLVRSEDDRMTEQLETVRSECYRMSDLIRRLMNFGQSEHLASSALDIVEVVSRSVQRFREHAPAGVNLVSDIVDGPLEVNASAHGLEQIVLNLCTNAREAIRDHGRIWIRLRRMDPDPEYFRDHLGLSHDHYAVLEVQDKGSGISPEIRERIFEPFFTTKQLGTTKGTGLGLSTVWQLVRQFNGRIHCYSESGGGTTFRVFLPTTEAKSMPRSMNFDGAVGGGERILVVDDEPLILRIVSRMLTKLGYKIDVAETGDAALVRLQDEADDYQLVILDMSMPGISGVECLQKIRLSGRQMPVLMSSGHDMESQQEALMSAGAQGILQKPYKMDELARRVRQIIDMAHSA